MKNNTFYILNNRMQSIFDGIGGYQFGVFERLPITLYSDSIGRANLLDVSLDDNIAELFIRFHSGTDPACLLTCDKGAAGTSEGVQHHRWCFYTVEIENLYEIFKVRCYPVSRKQRKGHKFDGYDFENNGSLQKL